MFGPAHVFMLLNFLITLKFSKICVFWENSLNGSVFMLGLKGLRVCDAKCRRKSQISSKWQTATPTINLMTAPIDYGTFLTYTVHFTYFLVSLALQNGGWKNAAGRLIPQSCHLSWPLENATPGLMGSKADGAPQRSKATFRSETSGRIDNDPSQNTTHSVKEWEATKRGEVTEVRAAARDECYNWN